MHMISFHQATPGSTNEGRSVTLATASLTPEGTHAVLGLRILIWIVETHSAYFIFYVYFLHTLKYTNSLSD